MIVVRDDYFYNSIIKTETRVIEDFENKKNKELFKHIRKVEVYYKYFIRILNYF